MKYAIRNIGTSEFLSGFQLSWSQEPAPNFFYDPQWVAGWDNCDMLLYPTQEDASEDLEKVRADGLHGMIEEIIGRG